MTQLEILQKARRLISAPENWCQNTIAMDAEGGLVGPTSDRATRWCLVGALIAAKGGYGYPAVDFGILDRLSYHKGHCSLISLNNNTDHATVLAVFDEAIKELTHA